MKRVGILLLFISIFYIMVGNAVEEFDIRIPDEALRIRIVANSNTEYDQRIKRSVRDSVQASVADLLKDVSSLKEAKEILNQNLSKIDNLVSNTLKKENYDFLNSSCIIKVNEIEQNLVIKKMFINGKIS